MPSQSPSYPVVLMNVLMKQWAGIITPLAHGAQAYPHRHRSRRSRNASKGILRFLAYRDLIGQVGSQFGHTYVTIRGGDGARARSRSKRWGISFSRILTPPVQRKETIRF